MTEEIKNDIVKEPVIEGGPDIEVDKTLQPGPGIIESPPAPAGDMKKMMDDFKAEQETFKVDKEAFQKEREEFRKEWDSKVDEIESLKDLYETPNAKEDLEDTEEPEGDKSKDISGKDVLKPGDEEDEEFMSELKKEIGVEEPIKKPQETEVLDKVYSLEVDLAEMKLKEELRDAITKFPKMDREEVLLGVERDPSADVFKLAEASQKKREDKEKQIRAEIESQIKEEGGKTMPSHPGVDGIPPAGTEPPVPESKDPWDRAKKGAKADLGIQ